MKDISTRATHLAALAIALPGAASAAHVTLAGDVIRLAAELLNAIEAAQSALAPIAEDSDSPAGVAFQILADALSGARPNEATASHTQEATI